MASTLRRNLEDQVTCAICQEHFTDPRLLPCLHTYCKKCLTNLVQAASKKKKCQSITPITCPECREVVKVNPGDVDKLKVNFQMNNLISLLAISSLEQQNTKSEQLLCENCTSKDPASGRCVDCCKFICEFCVSVHKRFLETRDHRLMSLDEVKRHGTPAMSQQPKCDKHKGEIMKLYCESCKQLICRDCTIVDHREHCYQFIDDVAQQHKKSLNAVLEGAIDAKSEVEKTKKLVEDMKAVIKETHGNVEKKIDNVINNEISVLKRKQASLKVQAKRCAEERMKCLDDQAQQLETKLRNIESSVKFTQDILQNNDNVTILSVSSEANNRLSSLVEEMKQLNKQPCRQDKFILHADQQSIENSIANGMVIKNEPISPAPFNFAPQQDEGISAGFDTVFTAQNMPSWNQGNFTTYPINVFQAYPMQTVPQAWGQAQANMYNLN